MILLKEGSGPSAITRETADLVRKTPKTLSARDKRVLAELVRDGRLSWRDLARRIGLSDTPTIRRVRALETAGIIRGYAAIVDEAKIGRPISVFISVSLERQDQVDLERFEAVISASPLVRSCYELAGDADYRLRVAVGDIGELQKFLGEVLRTIPGLKRISCEFALRTIVDQARPPVS